MKIAVLGSHPATKMLAPFGDPSWDIWACSPHNYSHGRLPRVTEWFELHKPALDPERVVDLDTWSKIGEAGRIEVQNGKPTVILPPTRPADYLEWVRDEVSKEIPVWVRDTAFFPNCRPYPEDELKSQFGAFFFTSSIAYMLAKAIAAEPEAIGLFGVMQASPNEYAYQRPGIQYFLQKAHDAGIKLVIPSEARLFDVQESAW